MKCELVDVTKVQVVGNHTLYLTFDDGAEGSIDISEIIPFQGIFEPLKDQSFFQTVSVNADTGTIIWENGADISPAYLRRKIKNHPKSG